MLHSATFDVESLRWYVHRSRPVALEEAVQPPSWPAGREALEQIFGIDRPQHFLRHHRGLMPRLWETQITQAVRAMLLERPERTIERCQALLVALRGSGAPEITRVGTITADAEDRMDLAIHCTTSDGRGCCIVIEAKLESPLSKTQLRKYLQLVTPRYPHAGQRHLWVIATKQTPKTAASLQRDENAEWNFMTWRRLLINWQKALPVDPGSEVLSLFGEIWKRVGGY